MANDVFKKMTDEVLSDENIPWRQMQGACVLVTGATGFIGGALTASLAAASTARGLRLTLVGHGRNAARGEELHKKYHMAFIRGNLCRPIPPPALSARPDYIFHCAAATCSTLLAARPADVLTQAAGGTRHILELARKARASGVVYLSSMEVYGQTARRDVGEDDWGILDLRSPRSCYPQSKRFCETLCFAYAAQHGVPVKTARLAQTFGPGVAPDDTRVFAQFAQSALAGRDIILHTQGMSQGNYCHTADAVRGVLTVLLKGSRGEAYNVANPTQSMTVREMAELVAQRFGGGRCRAVVRIPPDIETRGYAPDTGFRLRADKLMALGWQPWHSLPDMYRDMMAVWEEP